MTLNEQFDINGKLCLQENQVLSEKELFQRVQEALRNQAVLKKYRGYNVIEYNSPKGIIYLLCANITYLGKPHPLHKKRIQIKRSWQDFCADNPYADVRFIGIYSNGPLTIFVDFDRTLYMGNKFNNSSAHVSLNDLYQAYKDDYFFKTDANGHKITVMSEKEFKETLDTGKSGTNKDLEFFWNFNKTFPFGKWLTAEDCIKIMRDEGFKEWRQTEWAGWYLEYLVKKQIESGNYEKIVQYVADKKGDEPDFDLRFTSGFYGDLKASDIDNWEAPGNDLRNVERAIATDGKIWYIIYEYSAIKDEHFNLRATKSRMELVGNNSDKLSYARRMKYSVNFVRMSILEINPINSHEALIPFKQGHQPDGSPRNVKVSIDKKNMDNFIIYRLEWLDMANNTRKDN